MHLTRTMAVSLAERNVLVNCICPGVFPSRMTAYGLEENKDVLEGIQPTGMYADFLIVHADPCIRSYWLTSRHWWTRHHAGESCRLAHDGQCCKCTR